MESQFRTLSTLSQFLIGRQFRTPGRLRQNPASFLKFSTCVLSSDFIWLQSSINMWKLRRGFSRHFKCKHSGGPLFFGPFLHIWKKYTQEPFSTRFSRLDNFKNFNFAKKRSASSGTASTFFRRQITNPRKEFPLTQFRKCDKRAPN